MGTRYRLPEEVRHLVHARNVLRARYEQFGLRFTPDGNMVGDLGEAIAAELFGLTLAPQRGFKAIDAYTDRSETVQIKASGGLGRIQFTHAEDPATWLLVLNLDYEAEAVEVVYNGAYAPAVSRLPSSWAGQKSVAVSLLRRLDAEVGESKRLPARSATAVALAIK